MESGASGGTKFVRLTTAKREEAYGEDEYSALAYFKTKNGKFETENHNVVFIMNRAGYSHEMYLRILSQDQITELAAKEHVMLDQDAGEKFKVSISDSQDFQIEYDMLQYSQKEEENLDET